MLYYLNLNISTDILDHLKGEYGRSLYIENSRIFFENDGEKLFICIDHPRVNTLIKEEICLRFQISKDNPHSRINFINDFRNKELLDFLKKKILSPTNELPVRAKDNQARSEVIEKKHDSIDENPQKKIQDLREKLEISRRGRGFVKVVIENMDKITRIIARGNTERALDLLIKENYHYKEEFLIIKNELSNLKRRSVFNLGLIPYETTVTHERRIVKRILDLLSYR